MIDVNECYSVTEVCKLLNISRMTFYNWRENGTIQTIKINGRVLIRRSEVERLLNEHVEV